MSEINPTRINQPAVDTGSEVSADGVPIQQMAAPTSRQTRTHINTLKQANGAEPITSMEQLPLTEDSPKAGEIKSQNEEAPATEQSPTEELAPVDFTDFLKASATEQVIPEDKTQKPKVEEEPVEDLETGTTPITTLKEVPLSRQQKLEKIANDKKTRDLTGIPDTDKDIFINNMSRAAFDKVAPIVKEYPILKQKVEELNQQLEKAKKGGLPDSYYEHPQGFVLSPEYNIASQRVNTAQAIVNHWQQQFAELRGGAAEYTNIGFDQQGNLIETGKIKAGPEAEAQILTVLNTVQAQAIKEQAKLESLQMTHQDKYKQTLDWLNQYEAQRVGIFNAEEGKKFLPQVQQILKSFPSTLQANPLAISVAKRDVVIMQLASIIQAIKKEQTNGGAAVQQNGNGQTKPNSAQQRVQQTRRLAGPNSSNVGGDAVGSKGGLEITMDAFEAAKNGY